MPALYSLMPSRRYRWARWGWLATTVALGAALVISAWIARERAAGAADTLNRGQAGVWLESVRHVLREAEMPVGSGALDSLFGALRDAGVEGISLFDSSGALAVQAGIPVVAPRSVPDSTGPGPVTMVDQGNRITLVGPALGGRPGDEEGGRSRRRPFLVVMEFTPVAAHQLVEDATRRFWLSSLVAAALLGAALVFWRLITLHEVAERRYRQQEQLSKLGEMSAVLAHEIRNPLASLKGHAQLLTERLGDGSAEGNKARLVVREAERLEAITNDLLGFARSGPIAIEPADPMTLLRSCADEVAPGGFILPEGGAPDTWPLDSHRMRRALVNILRNARQASPEHTRPEASVRIEHGRLVFAVRDYGPGIPAGDERRIFEPFYTTRTSGTGLGLAVAARVAEMHDGEVRVRNHPEGGAVFSIAIPRGLG